MRTLAVAGRTDEARKMLAEFLQGEPKPTGFWDGWFLPEVYAALGDKDEAFRWLEAAVKERSTFIPWMRENPTFCALALRPPLPGTRPPHEPSRDELIRGGPRFSDFD